MHIVIFLAVSIKYKEIQLKIQEINKMKYQKVFD